MLQVASLDRGHLLLGGLLGRSGLSACLRCGSSSLGSSRLGGGGGCLLDLCLGGCLSCGGHLRDVDGFLFLGHGDRCG